MHFWTRVGFAVGAAIGAEPGAIVGVLVPSHDTVYNANPH
jgi:hypothetical protein